MDFFSRLPPEIRRNIIVHVESYSAIMKLIRASPTMLWQYTTDRHGIAREILKPILALDDDGTILRDALIIAHTRNYDTVASTGYTLGVFLDVYLPDPVAKKDRDMTMKLYRVISFAICWIEDYVAKATDACPSRAYMALPEMATGWTGTRCQDEIVDIKPVFFSQLRSSERCRFLRAFLRLEALCRYEFLGGRPHRHRFFLQSHVASLIRDPSNKDWDSILCCAEYLRILYKSLFNEAAWVKRRRSVRIANKQTAPSYALPDRPSSESPMKNTGSLERGTSLRFPESVCVSIDSLPLPSPYKTSIFGFSDLSSMLVSVIRTGKRPYLTGHCPDSRYRLNHLYLVKDLVGRLDSYRAVAIGIGFRPRSLTMLPVCIGKMDDGTRQSLVSVRICAEGLHDMICLQRAVGMFEDERLYSGGASTIPSLEDLQRLADDTWQSFGASKDQLTAIRRVYYPCYRPRKT